MSNYNKVRYKMAAIFQKKKTTEIAKWPTINQSIVLILRNDLLHQGLGETVL